MFQRNCSNVKKTWHIIWDLTSAGTTEQNKHKLIYDEKELTNDSDKANGFNDFFSGIGKRPNENSGNVNNIDPIA